MADKIQIIRMWVELGKAPGGFSSKFIDSLDLQLKNGIVLSQRQVNALDNIISKFKINDISHIGYDPSSPYSKRH